MATDEQPPTLTTRTTGKTVRFTADDLDGWVAAEVDDVRIEDRYIGVTVIEPGRSGRIFDLESHFDGRVGWTTVRAFRRDYSSIETTFVDTGELETIESIELGLDENRLRPGDTIEHVDGTVYRVIVPPREREYDDKVLAYPMSTSTNVAQKVDPSQLLVETLVQPTGGEAGAE